MVLSIDRRNEYPGHRWWPVHSPRIPDRGRGGGSLGVWVVTAVAVWVIREKLVPLCRGRRGCRGSGLLAFCGSRAFGGGSPSPKAGGERRLKGDPDSEVEESMSDQSSAGMSVRAALALGVGLPWWVVVTLETPLAPNGVVLLAFTLYWPGCLVLQPLHLVFHFLSNGNVHELPQRRHLALVHLPLCARMISWPASPKRAMCWSTVRTSFLSLRTTAGGIALGRPRELFSWRRVALAKRNWAYLAHLYTSIVRSI